MSNAADFDKDRGGLVKPDHDWYLIKYICILERDNDPERRGAFLLLPYGKAAGLDTC